jgi:carbamoyl-phosphate synthase large subunit
MNDSTSDRRSSPYRQPMRVLVAGIGGASLGTEVVKALHKAGDYIVFGCDVSEHAYGHYDPALAGSFVPPRAGYAAWILRWCQENEIRAVVPGGEEPLALLSREMDFFAAHGILIAANSPEVVQTCSDKGALFDRLRTLGIPCPKTEVLRDPSQLPAIPFPWVVKPAVGTGGSSLVFLAATADEARAYLALILSQRATALVQEYVSVDDGEFTVGVLSLPDGRLVGSVAMRRLFHTKLSVSLRCAHGLISSGYSQGLIQDFPEVRRQCEAIAAALGSRGPLNVQGRLRGADLLPFEINPRFSASTHLRAMAGFNEIDLYLRTVVDGAKPEVGPIHPGYYLRSLTEAFVSKEGVRR